MELTETEPNNINNIQENVLAFSQESQNHATITTIGIDDNQFEYVPGRADKFAIKSMIQHHRFRIIVAQLQINMIDLLNMIDFMMTNLRLLYVANVRLKSMRVLSSRVILKETHFREDARKRSHQNHPWKRPCSLYMQLFLKER